LLLEWCWSSPTVDRKVTTLAFPDWPPPSAEGRAPTRVATIEEVERSHILEVLEATGWKVSGARGAAALLGMPATSLETRMKRLGIVRKR